MWGPFSKNFPWKMGDKLLGLCSKWEKQWSDHAKGKGGGCFTNTFLNNNFSFFQSWRDIHLTIKPWPKLWKYSYLKLIVKRFQRLCHVQLDLDIFVKLTVKIEDCIRKTPSAHYALGVGDFMQTLPSFVISCMVTCTLMP